MEWKRSLKDQGAWRIRIWFGFKGVITSPNLVSKCQKLGFSRWSMKQIGYSRGRLKLCLNHETHKHCPAMSCPNPFSFSSVIHSPFCCPEGSRGRFQPADQGRCAPRALPPCRGDQLTWVAEAGAWVPWTTLRWTLGQSIESLSNHRIRFRLSASQYQSPPNS